MYSNVVSSALILLFGSFVSVANAALPVLTPLPQQLRWTSGAESRLAARAVRGVVVDAALPANLAALERLSKALHTSLSPSPDGNLKLVLGVLPATIPDRNRREAYVLVVDSNGATITAETGHGIHHGLISLALLADPEKGIPCVTISDWPDQQMRGTYVPGVEQAETRFDQFVALKLNLLLLEDPRLYDLDNPETCARFQRLAERCRANFIDFVPELQSLGWGQAVLEREPALWRRDGCSVWRCRCVTGGCTHPIQLSRRRSPSPTRRFKPGRTLGRCKHTTNAGTPRPRTRRR